MGSIPPKNPPRPPDFVQRDKDDKAVCVNCANKLTTRFGVEDRCTAYPEKKLTGEMNYVTGEDSTIYVKPRCKDLNYDGNCPKFKSTYLTSADYAEKRERWFRW